MNDFKMCNPNMEHGLHTRNEKLYAERTLKIKSGIRLQIPGVSEYLLLELGKFFKASSFGVFRSDFAYSLKKCFPYPGTYLYNLYRENITIKRN
jgi:hypothetical protein